MVNSASYQTALKFNSLTNKLIVHSQNFLLFVIPIFIAKTLLAFCRISSHFIKKLFALSSILFSSH
ncbi:hypothetical protein FF021_10400 [Leptospira noguchii]|uniref:Uncharacterized protein n=1 Tax=Leptospira noguchii serovar Autumnalis str. ZUN142 TaxID=1085540 RepID=M6UVB8_9LEPT|nr:hypothetical protein LEP1GSC170_2076 [Leptospira interrogans serovar Bataviae str. HAI135]EMO41243.1 hypothetical protein LEP1GSC186_3051 [Leptospira noguchii serovar Autumnalis str. ZUN142]TQE75063.1 hypothetical protein FF021_10400 [Leptospira noguchii]